MSQHPSLLGSQKGKAHRSVLKRYEKLKYLVEKEKWDDQKSSIYSMPKIKQVKFKVKKEKAAASAEEAAVAPGAAPAPGAAAGPAKAAAGKPAAAAAARPAAAAPTAPKEKKGK